MTRAQLPIVKRPNASTWTAAGNSSKKRKTEREIEQLYASGALFSAKTKRKRKAAA